MATTRANQDAAAANLARLRSPQHLAEEPLPFWSAQLRWITNPQFASHFSRESRVKRVWMEICSQYRQHYAGSFEFDREDEHLDPRFPNSNPTIADFVIYAKKPGSSLDWPPEPVPLSIIENKLDLGSVAVNTDIVGQVVRACLARLWTGTPAFRPGLNRLEIPELYGMARHSPMLGISACGSRFRRVIVLNAHVGFIDQSETRQSDTSNTATKVSYESTEWIHALFHPGSLLALDLHFRLVDLYSNYITSLPWEEGRNAYGDSAKIPLPDRALDDGFTKALITDAAAQGMVGFDPSTHAHDQQGVTDAISRGPPGPGGGDGDGSRRDSDGAGGSSSRKRKTQDSGPGSRRETRASKSAAIGQSSSTTQTKDKHVAMNRDHVATSPPARTSATQTEESTHGPRTPSDTTVVGFGSTSDLGKDTDLDKDVFMGDDSAFGTTKMSSSSTPASLHSESTPVDVSEAASEVSVSNPFKPPLTKEQVRDMDAMLRPMRSMTREERKAVFGVVGEDWEAFAEAYMAIR